MIRDFAGRCATLTVYIKEAHARDEWRLDGSVDLLQPRTTTERVRVARQFQTALQWQTPILVDPPEDEQFERLFAPWPIRFYIVQGNVDPQSPLILSHVADPVGETFDIIHLREQLERAITNMS